MPLTTLKYGDCTSYNGQIRENVGLLRCRIREVSLYVVATPVYVSTVLADHLPITPRLLSSKRIYSVQFSLCVQSLSITATYIHFQAPKMTTVDKFTVPLTAV